jgi:hypothetical protein
VLLRHHLLLLLRCYWAAQHLLLLLPWLLPAVLTHMHTSTPAQNDYDAAAAAGCISTLSMLNGNACRK